MWIRDQEIQIVRQGEEDWISRFTWWFHYQGWIMSCLSGPRWLILVMLTLGPGIQEGRRGWSWRLGSHYVQGSLCSNSEWACPGSKEKPGAKEPSIILQGKWACGITEESEKGTWKQEAGKGETGSGAEGKADGLVTLQRDPHGWMPGPRGGIHLAQV